MKKFYLSTAMVAILASTFAQSNTKEYSFRKADNAAISLDEIQLAPWDKSQGNDIQGKALTTLWEDDFSGSGATNTNQGQWTTLGANGSFWTMETTVHPLNSLNGTRFNNFLTGRYLTWDSYNPIEANEADFATTAVFGEISTPSIDLSSATGRIGIQFNTQTGYCCNYQEKPYKIYYSNDDGATWSAPLSLAFNGAARNVFTDDTDRPLLASFDVTSIAVAPTATSKFKLSWTASNFDPNGQYNSHYYWMIDDFKVYTIPDNDLAVTNNVFQTLGFTYFKVPTTQVADLEFSTVVKNNGLVEQTNVLFKVDINAGDTVLTSASGVTIQPAASDSLIVPSFMPPATVASYSIARSLTQDATDDIPGDNKIDTVLFDVTSSVYARDNGVLFGSNGDAALGTDVGVLYDIFTDQTLYGLDFRLSPTQSLDGSSFKARLYEYDPNAADLSAALFSTYLGESSPTAVVLPNAGTNVIGNVGSIQTITFQLPIDLVAGKTYFATISSPTGGVYVSSTASSVEGCYYTEDKAIIYSVGGTPMIRMNFDPKAGLGNNNETVVISNLFPNPTTNSTTLNYDLNAATDVTVSVTDVTGKAVYSNTVTNQAIGAHSLEINAKEFNSGIYFVNLTSAGSTVTRKLIKK
jgi:hypothetical protein